MLFKSKKPSFSISIPRGVLEAIYDECDSYAVDETGGRLLGTYRQNRGKLEISVEGLIDPGPLATRSPTSFFQDGAYQEQVFREIEARRPEIEHLGSWHTHHVNGLQTLSSGDKTTYFKTVNHKNHNTDFFYALLVVSKGRGKARYIIKHFIFRRDDDTIYEIPDHDITISDEPAIVPSKPPHRTSDIKSNAAAAQVNGERAADQAFFADFYPKLKPLVSKDGAPYWKGTLNLIDGSDATLVAIERQTRSTFYYSIATSLQEPSAVHVLKAYEDLQFPSARHAVLSLERDINRALYLHATPKKRDRG